MAQGLDYFEIIIVQLHAHSALGTLLGNGKWCLGAKHKD